MSYSFVPLGGVVSDVREFRPLSPGTEGPVGGSVESAAVEAAGEPGDELRRAFQAGYQLARDELGSEVETSIAESFVKAIEELAAFRARLRDRYERELLEVALGVARKVVHQEVTERPDIWLTMIRAAVRRAVEREHIVVRVPGVLGAFLRMRAPALRAVLENVKELEIVDDPGLPATGCVVESRFGEVD